MPIVQADTIDEQIDFTGVFNNDSFSFDADTTDGNITPTGESIPADGITSPLVVGGVSFNFGDFTNGELNALDMLGQEVLLPGVRANSIQFLATNSYENFAYDFVVKYNDNSTETTNVGTSFWLQASPTYGETVAYTADHRNTQAGVDNSEQPKIYKYSIPIDNTKTLTSITLPNTFEDVKLFALTIVDKVVIVLTPPTVTTGTASQIILTTANVSGNVTADGNATVTERGIVYSSSNATPTTSDSKQVVDGTTGEFTANLTSLLSGTTYHARAYAINSEGTSYGSVIDFTTVTSQSYTNAINIPNAYIDLGIPQGIMVLDSGNIWYVDQQNYRIILVNQSGQILRKIGRHGTAEGEFKEELQAMTKDTAGNLYVLDTCHVYKLDSNGGFISSWGTCFEENASSMREARAITFDAFSNRILIADSEHHRVLKYSLSGQYQGFIGSQGNGNGQFSFPQGLKVDASGKIYIVDGQNHRVQVFNASGTFLSKFGTQGSDNGQLLFPKDLVLLTDGKIAVSSQNSQRIQIFNTDGTYFNSWGENGVNDNQFIAPSALSRDASDNIYVADWQLKSIQKFSKEGVYSLAIRNSGKTAGKLTSPTAVTYDAAGNMYILDDGSAYARVQKFNNTGTFISTIIDVGNLGVACYHMAIDSTGRILVSCQGEIHVFDSTGTHLFDFGTPGTEDGQFLEARGIDVDSSGNIYVADLLQSRVQKFDNTGAFLLKWGVPGMGNGEFNGPEAVTVDADNKVYVGEYYVNDKGIGLTRNSRVQVFNNDGTYLRTIGSFGEQPDQLWDVGGVAVDNTNNRVYVVNKNTNQVKMYTATEGAYIESIGGYGSEVTKFTEHSGISINPITSTLSVADTGNHRVQSFVSGARIVNLISSNDVQRAADDYSLSNNYVIPSAPESSNITSQMTFGDYIVSDFAVDLTQDRDWAQVRAVTLEDTSKSLIANLNPSSAPGVSSTHSIYVVKKVGQTGVRVCPDATSLSEVTMNCSNGYALEEGAPSLSTETIGGVDYWKISGLTGTGAMSLTTDHLTITPSKVSVTAGEAFTVTVEAKNAANATDTTYRETVLFTSTSGSVSLPANYTYNEVDSGTHTFTVYFNAAGNYTITATDTITGTLTATTASIQVTATTPIIPAQVPVAGSITYSGATITGQIDHNGGSGLIERGVVYSTSNATPTTADSKTIVAGGTGSFSAVITGLLASTHYYTRVYASNAQGTSYGSVIEFTTSVAPTPSVTATPTPTPAPTLPASLQNVYTTFAKFKYGKYIAPAALKKGDTIYLKNFDPNKVKVIQIFLYDYAKKGNQGYVQSKVTKNSMFLRTTGTLPSNKQYAYVVKLQDKATKIITTKYFLFYTAKTWQGKSVLGASDVADTVVATETPEVTKTDTEMTTAQPTESVAQTSLPPTTTPVIAGEDSSMKKTMLLIGGIVVIGGVLGTFLSKRKTDL